MKTQIESVIDAIARAPDIVVPLVREVPPEVLKVRPKPGKWSAHEHACHLAEVNPLFISRLERMLSEASPRITPYDPSKHDPDALLAVDLDDALDRFVRERAVLVEKVHALKPADWERTAQHPEYSRYSVFTMLRHLALHDLLHAYRIEEIALSRTIGR